MAFNGYQYVLTYASGVEVTPGLLTVSNLYSFTKHQWYQIYDMGHPVYPNGWLFSEITINNINIMQLHNDAHYLLKPGEKLYAKYDYEYHKDVFEVGCNTENTKNLKSAHRTGFRMPSRFERWLSGEIVPTIDKFISTS